MRVTYKAEEGRFKALVRGRNMHGEFEVDFYVDGVVHAPARYFTDDRADAESTADAWVAGQAGGAVVVGGRGGRRGRGGVIVGAGGACPRQRFKLKLGLNSGLISSWDRISTGKLYRM